MIELMGTIMLKDSQSQLLFSSIFSLIQSSMMLQAAAVPAFTATLTAHWSSKVAQCLSLTTDQAIKDKLKAAGDEVFERGVSWRCCAVHFCPSLLIFSWLGMGNLH